MNLNNHYNNDNNNIINSDPPLCPCQFDPSTTGQKARGAAGCSAPAQHLWGSRTDLADTEAAVVIQHWRRALPTQ